MDGPVVQFGQFGFVPAVGGPHEVSGDALQAVDVCAATSGAGFQIRSRVLVSAVHAPVAVVVHRPVAHVVVVHHVHDAHDGFGLLAGRGEVAIVGDLSCEELCQHGYCL